MWLHPMKLQPISHTKASVREIRPVMDDGPAESHLQV